LKNKFFVFQDKMDTSSTTFRLCVLAVIGVAGYAGWVYSQQETMEVRGVSTTGLPPTNVPNPPEVNEA
jgi:hypothetical protein